MITRGSCSVCVNVRRGYDGRSLKLDMINLNSSSSWFHRFSLTQLSTLTLSTQTIQWWVGRGWWDADRGAAPRADEHCVRHPVGEGHHPCLPWQHGQGTHCQCSFLQKLQHSITSGTGKLAKWTPLQEWLRNCNTTLQVVNLQGKLKSSKRQASELHFDFSISCIVCLTDR